MNLEIPAQTRPASADWDVEAELQKELDAVSVCSHISSSSSSTEAEETFPDDEDDGVSSPLHKLLDNWRVKETKLQSFETMLSGTNPWQYDILDEIRDQGRPPWPGPSDDGPKMLDKVHCTGDPKYRSQQPVSKGNDSPQFASMTFSEKSAPSYLQQRRTGSKCADVKATITSEGENGFAYSSMDYEDALSMLRKKRMVMLEEYRAAEAERFVEKSLKRQTETEESRKILLLASQRRQELENEIWKEKREKIALLDLELAKRTELFEELQRTEQHQLQAQILDIDCMSRSVMVLVDTSKHQEEKLEPRRLEQGRTLYLTVDQDIIGEPDEHAAPQDHLIKCCVRIQSWIRGFLCRRECQDLKQRSVHSGVSRLLPDESADIQPQYEREYPMCEQDEEGTGTVGLSEETPLSILDQEYQRHGAQGAHEPTTMSREESQSPEEILTMLTGLAKSGNMQDFQSYLNLAKSNGLIDEASEVEDQLNQRKEDVKSWLEQVILGWDTTRSKIEEEIQEARRLEMFPVASEAEGILFAREKEIHDNLEGSIVRASRRDYGYWMRKAKNFGLKDVMVTFSKAFQRTLRTVRNGLKREAKLGTKEKYVVLFKNAISLGLQSDVNLALKFVLKRVLQVFKRAILLECTPMADPDSKKHDWSRVEMEGAEIGLDFQFLANLRQTIALGRNMDSAQRSWTTTFKANDTGGPLTLQHGKHNPSDAADPSNDGPECGLSFKLQEVARPPSMSFSAVFEAAAMPKSVKLWSLPQNWLEMNRLQRDWQEHTLRLRSLVIDNPHYAQHGVHPKREHDCLPAKCARDEILESTVKNLKENVDVEPRPIGCLGSGKDGREEEEGFAELSEGEENSRGESDRAQISETLEQQANSTRKCTLTRQMLEEKLNCTRAELRWVMKLDLTDEQLKSLGSAQAFGWCPRVRFLTVDMNMLTSLKGAFQYGENSLEQLSLKDNLLRDMVGLECLPKLNVLHLDGNLLSQLGFPCSSPSLPSDIGKKVRNANTSLMAKNSCNLTPQLGGRSVVEYCWPRLKVLTVGRNRLTKICKIGNLCPNLEVLNVGSNQIFSLGGNDDNSLAGLHHLRTLDVGQNRLQGRSLWKGLDNCPEIVSLVASRNKLREFPNHFGSVLLREIWLNGNAIKSLSCKAWLPSLQRLYLQDNVIDTLESLWGCPALEVLDLSFNSLADLSHLRHLSCFPSLRSLQLNDNPFSEHENHATYVLEAVPWLAELDNEAVTKPARDRAVRKIYKNIMDVVGIEFMKEKLQRGEALSHGFSNPSGAQKCSLSNAEQSSSNAAQFLPQQDVNSVLNGDADEAALWDILSEVKRMASSSSTMRDLLDGNADVVKFEGLHNFSESEVEARSNMIAYQQMTLGLRGRVHAATKETCISRLLKERDQSASSHQDTGQAVESPSRAVPFLNLSSESHLSCDKVRESNLEWCLEEHTMFDSTTCREVCTENTEYKLQAQAQAQRVTRLQALARGHLTRIRFRLLRDQKAALRQEEEHNCARKIQAECRRWQARRNKLLESRNSAQSCAAVTIQAHWRGCSMRLRLRRALDMAKYTDDDDFDYVSIDNTDFLARERALSARYQSTESAIAAISNSSIPMISNSSIPTSEAMITPVDEILQASAITDRLHIKTAEWEIPALPETENKIAPVDETFQAHPAPNNGVGLEPADRNNHVLPEMSPFEFASKDAKPSVSLVPEVEVQVEVDSDHVTEVSQVTVSAESLSLQASEGLSAPEETICSTHRALKGTGLEILKEDQKKDETKEPEGNDITELLQRIGIKSKLNAPVNDAVAERLVISEEVSRIVKGHLEEISQPSRNCTHNIKAEEGDLSSIPAAEVKKRATVEELAKDWGFKSERTAQALLKARQRTQQKAKDVAQRTALQDPERRLKRFREKVQGQVPPVGAPLRHLDKRASLSFSGFTLQVPVDEQESYRQPEPEILHKFESNLRKLDGRSSLPVPRVPHHQRKSTDSLDNKNGIRMHPTRTLTRDLSAMYLPTVVLSTALQVSPRNL